MKSISFAQNNLLVTSSEIEVLFEPFVIRRLRANVPAWLDEIGRRQRKIYKRYIKRRWLGWLPSTQRTEHTVVVEYSKAWQESEYEKYRLNGQPPRVSPWEWQDQKMFASDVGATRFRQLLIIRLIERLRPRRILEVGCGNGINLILLAGYFPEIEFTGIELTEQGHRAARTFQQKPRLPAEMEQFAPLPLKDPHAFRRINFLQGNAAELPFADNSYDLVMSILALEQMERIRQQALSEISRVTANYLLNIEPFKDVNKALWPRRNVIQRNYFRGAIDDMNRYGVKPVMAINDFPQEAFLRVCALLSEKT
jgi:SAM-dependent methyltransferase